MLLVLLKKLSEWHDVRAFRHGLQIFFRQSGNPNRTTVRWARSMLVVHTSIMGLTPGACSHFNSRSSSSLPQIREVRHPNNRFEFYVFILHQKALTVHILVLQLSGISSHGVHEWVALLASDRWWLVKSHNKASLLCSKCPNPSSRIGVAESGWWRDLRIEEGAGLILNVSPASFQLFPCTYKRMNRSHGWRQVAW